jgi:hypothetical protein
VNGILETQKLQLGGKWMLSGVGDAHGNDEWLRLFDFKGSGYHGGFAAGKLWSSEGRVQGSDVRLKKEIATLDDSVAQLLTLRGVRFKWRDAGADERFRIGLIAQEVEGAFPELVEVGPDGMKGINYSGLIAPLVEAVKRQHGEIAALRAELRSLKKRSPARKNRTRGGA